MAFENRLDFLFSAEGDFLVDGNTHDFADTKNHQYRDLIQRILTEMMSRKGDWRLNRSVGVGFSRFLGRLNNRELLGEIKRAVSNQFVSSQLVSPGDIVVEAFPVSEESIALIINMNPRGASDQLVLSFTYNMKDNIVIPRNI